MQMGERGYVDSPRGIALAERYMQGFLTHHSKLFAEFLYRMSWIGKERMNAGKKLLQDSFWLYE
jgi:hypothetical protein